MRGLKRRPINRPVPVLAIVGWREGADIGILGSGVLIGPRFVLTAGHVVQRQARPKAYRYRVYSPWVGVKTIEEIHLIPDRTTTPTTPGAGLAVLELESDVPNGLQPFKAEWERPDGAKEVDVFGFGGDYTGILQALTCELRGPSDDGMIGLDLSARLGPRDSGSPLLVRDPDCQYRVAGVYAGLRRMPAGGIERFGVALGSHEKVLKSFFKRPGSSSRTDLRQLKIKPTLESDLPAYTIGIDETNEHRFRVPKIGWKTTLIVAVNSTSLPLRSRPRMTVRLYHGDEWVDQRGYPGPLQSFRRVSRSNAGTWRIEVSSETEVSYQVAATLYT